MIAPRYIGGAIVSTNVDTNAKRGRGMSKHVKLLCTYENIGNLEIEDALEDGFELVQTTIATDGYVWYLLVKPAPGQAEGEV